MGPAEIVVGRTYDYNKIYGPGSIFGEYVQSHESTDNIMQERTVSALTLRPSGNVQGSFYYYSLATGRRLHRRRCTPIPMFQDVIDRVHMIADRQKTPEGITFLRMDGTEFEDLLQSPALGPTPINNDGGDNTDEPIVVDDDEVEDQHDSEIEYIPVDEDDPIHDHDDDIAQNDEGAVIQDEAIDLVPDIHPDDVEVEIPAIEEIAVQGENIIQDDNDTEVNLDVVQNNILPDGAKRGRVPQRRHAEEGY